MYDALWNPVLFVIYIAEQREIGLGLNTHIFEFDCFFAHEATFNGRSAVGLGVFSLTILQQQIIAGFDRLVRRCPSRRRTLFWRFACWLKHDQVWWRYPRPRFLH